MCAAIPQQHAGAHLLAANKNNPSAATPIAHVDSWVISEQKGSGETQPSQQPETKEKQSSRCKARTRSALDADAHPDLHRSAPEPRRATGPPPPQRSARAVPRWAHSGGSARQYGAAVRPHPERAAQRSPGIQRVTRTVPFPPRPKDNATARQILLPRSVLTAPSPGDEPEPHSSIHPSIYPSIHPSSPPLLGLPHPQPAVPPYLPQPAALPGGRRATPCAPEGAAMIGGGGGRRRRRRKEDAGRCGHSPAPPPREQRGGSGAAPHRNAAGCRAPAAAEAKREGGREEGTLRLAAVLGSGGSGCLRAGAPFLKEQGGKHRAWISPSARHRCGSGLGLWKGEAPLSHVLAAVSAARGTRGVGGTSWEKKKEEAHYGCQGVWGMLQIEGTCSLRELCTQRQEGSAELMAVTWPSPPICC